MKISSTPTVDVEYVGEVAVLRLNRPDALNAFDGQLLGELGDILTQTRSDESRAIVITGNGRAFSAGGDHKFLAERHDTDVAGTASGVRPEINDLIPKLVDVAKPVIAAVNGVAVGLGATLALNCDYILISSAAQIGDRHVRIGLVPGIDAAIWVALLGPLKAKEILMSASMLSPEEAKSIGIVNDVVEPDELLPRALAYAQRLAAFPPYALQATKAAVNLHLQSIGDRIAPAALAWEQLSMISADHREALLAHSEKRPGRYTGR
jgi:enoyl-CoA hydratase